MNILLIRVNKTEMETDECKSGVCLSDNNVFNLAHAQHAQHAHSNMRKMADLVKRDYCLVHSWLHLVANTRKMLT